MPLINNSYRYTNKELLIVDAISKKISLVADDWNDTTLKDLKLNVKKAYRKKQQGKCCYCGYPLPKHARSYDLDHIISRDQAVCYMLWPNNLAACCTDCNSAKGANVVVNKTSIDKNNYPARNEINVVHPHLDEYDEHISVIGGLYLGLQEKGAYTISICNLTRYHEAALRKIANYENENDYVELLQLRVNATRHEEKALLDQLIVLHAKNRTFDVKGMLAAL